MSNVPLHAKPLEELIQALVDECIDDMKPESRAAKVADVTVAIDTLVRSVGGNTNGKVDNPVWHDHHEWVRRQPGDDYSSNDEIHHDHDGQALPHYHDSDGQIRYTLPAGNDPDNNTVWVNCPDEDVFFEVCDECDANARVERHNTDCSHFVEDEVNAAKAAV